MSGKGKFFDLQVPFFAPFWRRALVVALSLGWALFELANGATGWALIFGTAGLWCGIQFFVTWDANSVGADEENARKDKT